MNKFGIILSHTYLTRVKTKSFLITTAITILFILLAGNVQSIMHSFGGSNEQEIAVLDETGGVVPALKENLQAGEREMSLHSYEGTETEAKKDVRDGTFDGFLKITSNEDIPQGEYYSMQGNPSPVSERLQQALQPVKLSRAANNAGIDPAAVQQITSSVVFETVALQEDAKTAEEMNSARGLVYVMLFLLYLSVIMYGNMIAMDVANEKSSRVMEILVSSAPPVTQMFAKIAGIALLGLTQFGAIVVVGYIMLQSKQDQLTGGVFQYFGLQGAGAGTFIYALVFFLLGYLLYATLSATLGSLVSRTEDVNQLMAPVIYLIMIAFFIAIFGLSSPDNMLVTVTSFIPFFTPMLMFLRVTMLNVPIWEIVLSFGLIISAIIILAAAGARVYKGGVLLYGKSNSLKDVKRALQLSKKE
ncbi:ABC transporter permease [Salibacterium aidingense]|uniref:ABC transporter permease n=1 Tax=Salibacterium aidingense TaxID=384933 RepID=UPI00040BDA93|nr:ABC transporter permease [Salibacterium aidingense]